MTPQQTEILVGILKGRTVAALGTLQGGAPSVSMAPYVFLPDGSRVIIHVSTLSAHTRNLLADGRVGLLIMDAEGDGIPAQGLPRISLSGEAKVLTAGTAEHDEAKATYLGRFPDAAMLFDLEGFRLFEIRPTQVRFIAGFGQAITLAPASLAHALRSAV